MSYWSGIDFSRFDLDAPLPVVASMTKGPQSTVADQMAEAMEHAGGDGFLIASPVTRRPPRLAARTETLTQLASGGVLPCA